MALVKFDPWRSIERAENEMRHFFDDFKTGFNLSTSFDLSPYAPRVDTAEDDKNIYITAELPGLTKDNVKVTLADNVLTIQGKKERRTEETKKNFHRVERSFGEFMRQIELPQGAFKKDRVAANFDNGVLEVTVPKDEAKAPKSSEQVIPISAVTNGRTK